MKTQVLIAGGGPVGLTLALDLAWRGVRAGLVEQNIEFTGNPKAKTVHNRTLELFRRWGWGVPDKLRAAAPLGPEFPSHIYYVTRLTGELIAALRSALTFDSQDQLSPERALRIPQSFLEPVLRDEVRRHALIDFRLGWRFECLEQDADGVRAEIVHLQSGRRESVRAAYLAGCDGGHSTVRHALGIHMRGSHAVSQAVGGVFRAPDLWNVIAFEKAMHYNVLNDDLPCMATMGPLHPPDAWFWDVMRLPAGTQAKDLDACRLVDSLIGRCVEYEMLHVAPWSVHHSLAERYRDGRVFLLGDAAHLQSPAGGFGMNGGVGDAVNLGWKLAAVLRGWGGPALLDSYELERRQFHARALRETETNYEANDLLVPGLEDPVEGPGRRQALAERIQHTKPQNFKSLGITLGYRYEGSPIIVPDGTPEPLWETSRYEPTARPGHRAPHVWLADGQALFDLLGPWFTLLKLGPDEVDTSSLERAARVPLKVLRLREQALRDLYGANLALVRPDHHVAWRSDTPPGEPVTFWDTVRGTAP